MRDNLKFYNLSNDYLFKNVFLNHKWMKNLLKDLFHIKMLSFHYINTELPKENRYQANGTCDIVLESETEIVAVEMQNRKSGDLAKRSVLYVSRLYEKQWKKKDITYEEIKPVTLCWLLNYQYGEKELQEYEILEKKLHERFGDNIKIKLCNIKILSDAKYKCLFRVKEEKQIESLKEDPKFGEIVKEIIKFNRNEEDYYRMEVIDKMWTYEDEIRFERMIAHQKGRELGESIGERRGEKRGEKKGIMKTVKKMLQKDFNIETIIEVTGLSKNEIEKYEELDKI